MNNICRLVTLVRNGYAPVRAEGLCDMKKFLIITNKQKDTDLSVTNQIVDYIKTHGGVAITFFDQFDTKALEKQEVEGAIILGGDGTIIRAATNLYEYNIPILGVNLGTLGFLAEIEKHHVIEAMEKLFADEYQLEDRMLLEGSVAHTHVGSEENSKLGINDIVITRSGFSRIISLKIFVNDLLVDDFRGDGLIVSTPTGSTGYNLSAGGPVLIPQAGAIVITPICPHSLTARSIVVSDQDTIKIIIGKSKKTQEEEAIATFDGNQMVEMRAEDEITIKRAPSTTKLMKVFPTTIYEVLRNKLGNAKV